MRDRQRISLVRTQINFVLCSFHIDWKPGSTSHELQIVTTLSSIESPKDAPEALDELVVHTPSVGVDRHVLERFNVEVFLATDTLVNKLSWQVRHNVHPLLQDLIHALSHCSCLLKAFTVSELYDKLDILLNIVFCNSLSVATLAKDDFIAIGHH